MLLCALWLHGFRSAGFGSPRQYLRRGWCLLLPHQVATLPSSLCLWCHKDCTIRTHSVMCIISSERACWIGLRINFSPVNYVYMLLIFIRWNDSWYKSNVLYWWIFQIKKIMNLFCHGDRNPTMCINNFFPTALGSLNLAVQWKYPMISLKRKAEFSWANNCPIAQSHF